MRAWTLCGLLALTAGLLWACGGGGEPVSDDPTTPADAEAPADDGVEDEAGDTEEETGILLPFSADLEVSLFDGSGMVKLQDLAEVGAEATVVIFGDFDCNFSQACVAVVPDLARHYLRYGVSVHYVHFGETEKPEVAELYADIAPVNLYTAPSQMGHDMGIPAVPRMFIFNGEGQLVTEMYYVDDFARKVLDHLLSHSPSPPPQPEGIDDGLC